MSKRPRKESHEDEAETRRGSSIPRTPPKPLVRGLVPWSHSANSPARQRYLYLVLDDWERGYSIHRLGEGDFFESDAGLAARPSAAACPLVRVHAQDAYTCSFLDHVRLQDLGDASSGVQRFSPGIPVFDTETATAAGCSTMPAWKLGKDLLFDAASIKHWGRRSCTWATPGSAWSSLGWTGATVR
jgi:hypothetical protein